MSGRDFAEDFIETENSMTGPFIRLSSDESVLRVRNLCVDVRAEENYYSLIDDLNFDIKRGETVAFLGESGCGKSLTARAILNLLPVSMKLSGDIRFYGQELKLLGNRQWQKIRGERISMVMQDPMSSLNPVIKIGSQAVEFLLCHRVMTKSEAKGLILKWFVKAGIKEPSRVFDSFPGELSGGQCQRVLIALALILEPDLVIADEPTTALDVTTQRKVVSLLMQLCRERGVSVLLISHDLAMISQIADKVMVMYMGKIVEKITSKNLFKSPKHPYTKALLECHPQSVKQKDRKELKTIKGQVPQIRDIPDGCRFCSRCEFESHECRNAEPPVVYFDEYHEVSCFYVSEDVVGNRRS